jgi:hypothetical protein
VRRIGLGMSGPRRVKPLFVVCRKIHGSQNQ